MRKIFLLCILNLLQKFWKKYEQNFFKLCSDLFMYALYTCYQMNNNLLFTSYPLCEIFHSDLKTEFLSPLQIFMVKLSER